MCTIDLGSDCSLIQESVARLMQLQPEKTDDAMLAFNNTVALPIAQARINVEIDGIKYAPYIYILLDSQLGNEIILGCEILGVPDVAALSEAFGVRFFQKDLPKENILEVNFISQRLRPIQIDDINCEGLTSEDEKRLLKILNQYRRNISLSIEELGCADVPGMKIEGFSDQPIVRRPYRLSMAEREQVKQIVSELEVGGII